MCIFSPVAAAPTILSLNQLSGTAVKVDWKHPSGGAEVMFYVIHYSNSVANMSVNVAQHPPFHNIMGLTTGFTYTFSVEAVSKHLSGESQNLSIRLCKCIYCPVKCHKRWCFCIQCPD